MDTRKQKQTQRRNILVTSFSFFIISFVGWLYETVLMYLIYGEYFDRGFLTLPFCPIYGGVIAMLYFFLGTPNSGNFATWVEHFSAKRGWHSGIARMLRYVGYYLISMGLATGVELIIGLIFESAGCSLWSYCGMACNYNGIICLPISLFWGFLITIVMRYPFTWMVKGLEKIPMWILLILTIVFSIAMSVDFIFCLTKL